MMIENNAVIHRLAAQLDRLVARAEVISSNIANVDTPGYKARDVHFRDVLADSMGEAGGAAGGGTGVEAGTRLKQTHVKHMTVAAESTATGLEIVESAAPGRPDGNNVEIDREMLKLAENSQKYNTTVQLLARKLRQLHGAIDRSV